MGLGRAGSPPPLPSASPPPPMPTGRGLCLLCCRGRLLPGYHSGRDAGGAVDLPAWNGRRASGCFFWGGERQAEVAGGHAGAVAGLSGARGGGFPEATVGPREGGGRGATRHSGWRSVRADRQHRQDGGAPVRAVAPGLGPGHLEQGGFVYLGAVGCGGVHGWRGRVARMGGVGRGARAVLLSAGAIGLKGTLHAPGTRGFQGLWRCSACDGTPRTAAQR